MTIGDLLRIPGVTPQTVINTTVHVKSLEREWWTTTGPEVEATFKGPTATLELELWTYEPSDEEDA